MGGIPGRSQLLSLLLVYSASQADSIALSESPERESASVFGAVNGVAWLLEEQQELLVLAPLGWEETLDVRNF